MKAVLVLAGAFDLGFAAFHLWFWRFFRWSDELPRLSPANRGIMQVLNLCLIYVFLTAGTACIFLSDALAATTPGRFALGSFALFWALRAAYQPIYFGLEHPLSKALFVVFIAGVIVHAAPLLASGGI